MLTTLTAEDDHVSRPMAVQEVEVDGDLWFFSSRVPAQRAEGPQ